MCIEIKASVMLRNTESEMTRSADMKTNVNVNSCCLMTGGRQRQGWIAADALGLHNTHDVPSLARHFCSWGSARRRARPQLCEGAATRTKRLREGEKSDHKEKLKRKKKYFFTKLWSWARSRWRTLHFSLDYKEFRVVDQGIHVTQI